MERDINLPRCPVAGLQQFPWVVAAAQSAVSWQGELVKAAITPLL